MLLEETCTKLGNMKLYGMLESVRQRLDDPGHRDLSLTDFVGFLVDDEWLYRENRKLVMLLKKARFKEKTACIENIDYKSERGLKKAEVMQLAQNRYITAKQSVIITGPAGSGKSYLAQALGNHACCKGFGVHYIRVPQLAYTFVQAKAEGTYAALMNCLGRYQLLILDDFGLVPLTEPEKQDLLELAETRYGSGATMITSQLPLKAWHDYLGAGRIADALLERFVHNAHRFSLSATQSMRKAKTPLTGVEETM